jgi:hypothetical protein
MHHHRRHPEPGRDLRRSATENARLHRGSRLRVCSRLARDTRIRAAPRAQFIDNGAGGTRPTARGPGCSGNCGRPADPPIRVIVVPDLSRVALRSPTHGALDLPSGWSRCGASSAQYGAHTQPVSGTAVGWLHARAAPALRTTGSATRYLQQAVAGGAGALRRAGRYFTGVSRRTGFARPGARHPDGWHEAAVLGIGASPRHRRVRGSVHRIFTCSPPPVSLVASPPSSTRAGPRTHGAARWTRSQITGCGKPVQRSDWSASVAGPVGARTSSRGG